MGLTAEFMPYRREVAKVSYLKALLRRKNKSTSRPVNTRLSAELGQYRREGSEKWITLGLTLRKNKMA